jgi:hypothetical protein
MRRLLPIVTLVLACGGEPGTSPVETPEPVFRPVNGVVEDSMLSVPLPGIRVLIGDSAVVTDSQGRFSLSHRSGDFELVVEDYGYEPYRRRVRVYGDAPLNRVLLRGEAPYLLSCSFEADLLTATVVDLQGRKTLNRRSQSTITLFSNTTRYFREAYNWYWTPVDNLTWLAHVPHAGVVADTAEWRLEDADGYVRGARCVNQPGPCQDC